MIKEELDQIMDRLRIVVRAAVKEAMNSYLKHDEYNASGYLTADQASSFLCISKHTLYKKVERGELINYRAGKRKLLFKKEDLIKHIDNQSKSAT